VSLTNCFATRHSYRREVEVGLTKLVVAGEVGEDVRAEEEDELVMLESVEEMKLCFPVAS